MTVSNLPQLYRHRTQSRYCLASRFKDASGNKRVKERTALANGKPHRILSITIWPEDEFMQDYALVPKNGAKK